MILEIVYGAWVSIEIPSHGGEPAVPQDQEGQEDIYWRWCRWRMS